MITQPRDAGQRWRIAALGHTTYLTHLGAPGISSPSSALITCIVHAYNHSISHSMFIIPFYRSRTRGSGKQVPQSIPLTSEAQY